MPRRIRVCMVSPLYHPALGGVGRQAVYLAEFLHRRGLKLMVMCRELHDAPEWQPAAGMTICRIKATDNRKFDLNARSLYNIVISVSFSFNLMINLIRKRSDYDLVHFHGSSLPLIINVLPLKWMGKKVVAKVAGARTNIEAGSFKGKFFGIGALFIKILKNVDRFIVLSREIEEGLRDDGIDPGKIFRTSNFIVKDEFFAVSPEVAAAKKQMLGLHGSKKIITFSGRLVQLKRVDLLLQAVWLISQDRDDFRLIILGQGELYGELTALSAQLGIGHLVEFRGFSEKILDYLHASDIYVLTSDNEGMPNSLLEAMACRLPVISTRVGAVPDIIEDRKNGLLIAAGDVTGLKDALLDLLDHADLRSAVAAGAYATAYGRFGIDAVAERYVSLYEEVLSRPASAK